MKYTVAAMIAHTLEQAGVKRIWEATGDSLNGLSDSLNRMGTIARHAPCDGRRICGRRGSPCHRPARGMHRILWTG